MNPARYFRRSFACLSLALLSGSAVADSNVLLVDVPDYAWHAGCFGTASGNLMGFWDRHGFPDFYTGPTNDGLAPLRTSEGIIALWATQAGIDGRPPDQPGHYDDYYIALESVEPDPYLTAGREEHEPDCIGDFIGLSQDKWTQMNGECDGNIDGFSFVYWDPTGERRVNYQPSPEAGSPAVDLPSGLREWTRWRGASADVFSQLTDFNPDVEPGKGFRFEDLKAEIDAGFPVLLFLQKFNTYDREIGGKENVNPNIHGMLAYGYIITDSGDQLVRYRTSWASGGHNRFHRWNDSNWEAQLPLRGVIGYHPQPQIVQALPQEDHIEIQWLGPAAQIEDLLTDERRPAHLYQLEQSASLDPASFEPVGAPTSGFSATVPKGAGENAFFRIRLLAP